MVLSKTSTNSERTERLRSRNVMRHDGRGGAVASKTSGDKTKQIVIEQLDSQNDRYKQKP